MDIVKTEDFIVGRNKLKIGKLIRIELINRCHDCLRIVLGTIKEIKEDNDKLKIALINAIDTYNKEKTSNTVYFAWSTWSEHQTYFKENDSDCVIYSYKYIIKNATDASLKVVANALKKEHINNIKEWNTEIKKLQKEANEYKKYIREANKYIKAFESTYKI